MSQVDLADSDKWLWGIGTVCFFVIVYLASPVLTPFLLSLVLAYLADPFVTWLEGMRIPRTLGVLVAFGFLLLIFVFSLAVILPILWGEIRGLLMAIPNVVDMAQSVIIKPIAASLSIEFSGLSREVVRDTFISHWRELGLVTNSVVAELGRSSRHLLTMLGYGILVPVVTFYLLRDWNKLIQALEQLVPERQGYIVQSVVTDIDIVLSEFLRGQLLIMILLGLFYGLALRVIGLEYALIVGFVAGVVSFIPYFGPAVGVLLASLIALGHVEQAWLFLGILTVFGLGQLLESIVLSPVFVGDKIGLHPVWVILVVMVGGHLFGFIGILLALPVGAVARVLLSYSINRTHFGSSSTKSL
jgi:predicted PurR-regulated permease PerM